MENSGEKGSGKTMSITSNFPWYCLCWGDVCLSIKWHQCADKTRYSHTTQAPTRSWKSVQAHGIDLRGLRIPRAPRLQHLTPLTRLLRKRLSPTLESRVTHHQSVGKTRENLWLVLIAGSGAVLYNPSNLGRSQHHLSQPRRFTSF